MKKLAKFHMTNAFTGKLACQLFVAETICQLRNLLVWTSRQQQCPRFAEELFPRCHLPECLHGQHSIGIFKRESVDLSSRIKLSAKTRAWNSLLSYAAQRRTCYLQLCLHFQAATAIQIMQHTINTYPHTINPIPPGDGGRGGERKVPAPISTFENFLDI